MKSSVVFMKLDPNMSTMLVKLDSRYSKFLLTDRTIVMKLKKALYG